MAPPKPVLVVDDQATIRALVATMLTKLGYGPITQAKTGREGLSRLIEAQPVVVVSDINMPEMNGLEMLQAIRAGKSPADRNLPVVMLTAHSEAMVVGTALQLDANGFIVKPASGKHLGDRIERALANPLRAKPPEHYSAVTIPVVDTYGKVTMPTDMATLWKEMSGELPPPVSANVKVVALRDLVEGQVLGDWVTTMTHSAPALPPGTTLTAELLAKLSDLVEAGALPPEFKIRA
jgi:two-component system chemotaxis response regulator CheY